MIHKALAVAATTAAITAPSASAMLPSPDPPPSRVTGTAPLVVQADRPGGFDIADAAIGAGAAFGLVLAGAGGTVALRRSRRPQASRA